MIAVIRVVLIACYFVLICVVGCLYSIVRPFQANNVYWISRAMGKVAFLLGVEVEIRREFTESVPSPCVFVANHQNSLDLFLISNAVLPRTVTVGKKSLKWIPLFGQLYWFSGNILIDRKNRGSAFNTITQTVDKIRQQQLSPWLFAEGTRSYGRGLLPFKSGAFHTAVQAEVPIVPVCMSSTTGKVQLNRWNNGKVIINMLPPIPVFNTDKDKVRVMAMDVHQLMKEEIERLDQQLNQTAHAGAK